jgi:predicted DNA-binding transcriptional regulator YafY
MKTPPESDAEHGLLAVVGDLLRGERHSRHTIADASGRSLPTADRWIEQIEGLPHVRRIKEGKTTWILYESPRATPTKPATVGACVAASLAAVFEGTQHERNLKDARDYLLRLRGASYDDLDRKFVFAPRGGELALPEASGDLDEVIDALLETRLLRFDYRHNNGDRESPLVRPLSLIIFDHQFYVLVRRDDGSFYCYRFARMSKVDSTKETFAYPGKGEYNPRTILEPVFGIHIATTGPVEDVEVVLSGPWAPYASHHRWHPTQLTTPLENGDALVALRVRLCPELETWILGFGELALVRKPSSLRERIAKRLEAMSAAYSQPADRPFIAKADTSSPSSGRSARGDPA